MPDDEELDGESGCGHRRHCVGVQIGTVGILRLIRGSFRFTCICFRWFAELEMVGERWCCAQCFRVEWTTSAFAVVGLQRVASCSTATHDKKLDSFTMDGGTFGAIGDCVSLHPLRGFIVFTHVERNVFKFKILELSSMCEKIKVNDEEEKSNPMEMEEEEEQDNDDEDEDENVKMKENTCKDRKIASSSAATLCTATCSSSPFQTSVRSKGRGYNYHFSNSEGFVENGIMHIEKTADKWGSNGKGDEWQEKWWEHYNAAGQAEKWAHKWCSIDPNILEPGHAHVWHERWGETYDGYGGSTKYI